MSSEPSRFDRLKSAVSVYGPRLARALTRPEVVAGVSAGLAGFARYTYNKSTAAKLENLYRFMTDPATLTAATLTWSILAGTAVSGAPQKTEAPKQAA